jgi:hypothetical protein
VGERRDVMRALQPRKGDRLLKEKMTLHRTRPRRRYFIVSPRITSRTCGGATYRDSRRCGA